MGPRALRMDCSCVLRKWFLIRVLRRHDYLCVRAIVLGVLVIAMPVSRAGAMTWLCLNRMQLADGVAHA